MSDNTITLAPGENPRLAYQALRQDAWERYTSMLWCIRRESERAEANSTDALDKITLALDTARTLYGFHQHYARLLEGEG